MVKIVLINDYFAAKMGYNENVLPRALAKQGADVHLVTSDLQPPFPNYEHAYQPFLGPRQQPIGRQQLDGFVLHRLAHGIEGHGVYMRRLYQTLASLRPEIVQCGALPSLSTYQAVVSRAVLGYKLFVEEHTHWSVFRVPRGMHRRALFALYRSTMGRLLGAATERCYVIGPDVARIVVQYAGYPRAKVDLCPLGVDTDLFHPVDSSADLDERRALRAQLGFTDDEVVCIYSGRFTEDKNPRCLALAVARLRDQGYLYRALFVGAGAPEYVNELRSYPGCIVHPFVEWRDLPRFYRAADIGVWPRQESTSQLDAAACGLPLVLSNRVEVRERVEGNGLLYEQDDPRDLARQLLALADPQVRRRLGRMGAARIQRDFSWDVIARKRLRDYESALRH